MLLLRSIYYIQFKYQVFPSSLVVFVVSRTWAVLLLCCPHTHVHVTITSATTVQGTVSMVPLDHKLCLSFMPLVKMERPYALILPFLLMVL